MKNLLIFIILFFVEGSYCQIDKKINPHEEDIYVLYHDKSIPRWVEVLPMKTIPEDKLGLNFSNELSSYMLVEKNKKIVKFINKVYSIEKPGLYRFIDSSRSLINLISLDDQSSPMELVTALTALTMHGNKDNGLIASINNNDNLMLIRDSLNNVENALQTRPVLSITCHYNRLMIKKLLQKHFKIPNSNMRFVNVETTFTHNDYDNGHSLLELKIKNTWTLIDGDLGYIFQNNGKNLSAEEIKEFANMNIKPKFVQLAYKDFKVDPFFYNTSKGNKKRNYSGLMMAKYQNEDMTWEWMKKVYQIISYQ